MNATQYPPDNNTHRLYRCRQRHRRARRRPPPRCTTHRHGGPKKTAEPRVRVPSCFRPPVLAIVTLVAGVVGAPRLAMLTSYCIFYFPFSIFSSLSFSLFLFLRDGFVHPPKGVTERAGNRSTNSRCTNAILTRKDMPVGHWGFPLFGTCGSALPSQSIAWNSIHWIYLPTYIHKPSTQPDISL